MTSAHSLLQTTLMGMRLAFVLAVAATGCAEKAIEMRLDLPSSSFDVSCVNQVQVTVWNADFTTETQCVEVTPSNSLAAIQQKISGRFDLDMPDELIAVQFHARASETPGMCPSGDLMFYAGAEYDGGEEIQLPVMGLLDCSVRSASPTRGARLVDFAALIGGDPAAAPVCVAPAVPVPLVESGTIHASNMSAPDFSPTVSTTWETANIVDGKAAIPVWNSTLGESCPGIITYDLAGFVDSASCIQSGPTICGVGIEIEVPILSYSVALSSWDDVMIEAHKSAVLVTVWDAVTKKPIQGATITITTGDGEVVYGDWSVAQAKFTGGGGSGTAARGLAMVYSNEPVLLTIAAPGHRSQQRVVGSPWDTGGATIVVLEP